MTKKLTALTIACLMLSLFLGVTYASSMEVDQTSVVTQVIDGDTFVLDTDETVRFADIDTPERDEEGYTEAKNYVKNLVEDETVYLDIDDISRTDGNDRIVCVVYFDYNSTHLMNLNEALLVGGYAENYDHSNNEFSPSSWDLYVSKAVIPEFPLALITALFFVLVTIIAVAKKSAKSTKQVLFS